MKNAKPSEKQIREYLFGWLWTEENIMKPVREELAHKRSRGGARKNAVSK